MKTSNSGRTSISGKTKKEEFFNSFHGTFTHGLFIPTNSWQSPKILEKFYVVKELGLKNANREACRRLKDYIRIPSYIDFIAGFNFMVQHKTCFIYIDFKSLEPKQQKEGRNE